MGTKERWRLEILALRQFFENLMLLIVLVGLIDKSHEFSLFGHYNQSIRISWDL
jgi:hypothetical protein